MSRRIEFSVRSQLLTHLRKRLEIKILSTEEILESLEIEREVFEKSICAITERIEGKNQSQDRELKYLLVKQKELESEIEANNRLVDQEWAEINRLYQEFQRVKLQQKIVQIQWNQPTLNPNSERVNYG